MFVANTAERDALPPVSLSLPGNQVIVHAPSGDPAAPCSSGGCRIAWLPQPQRGFFSSNSSSSCPALQLLCPQPGTVLEADREHQFEVLVPRAAAVALGSDTAGWAMLQRCSSSSGLFAGQLMLPRVDSCFVAVQGEHAGAAAAAAAGAPWERMLALRVLPPVRTCEGTCGNGRHTKHTGCLTPPALSLVCTCLPAGARPGGVCTTTA
jgi:hypothetical protein